MAELVLMICLMPNMTGCTEKAVPEATADNVVACLKSAGDKVIEWQKANTQYAVIGWRCEVKGTSPATR
jgi:hypothetical protein